MKYLKNIEILEKDKAKWVDDEFDEYYRDKHQGRHHIDPNMGRGDDEDFDDEDLKNLNISNSPNAKIAGDDDPDSPLPSRYSAEYDDPEEEEGPGETEKEEVKEEEIDEEEAAYRADMDNLCYFIRKLFKNNRVDADVDYSSDDIKVYIYLQRREKIASLLKAFEVVYKLKKDILPEYYPEVELFENKQGQPVLQFTFNYGDDDDDEVDGNVDDTSKKPKDNMDDDFGPDAPF